MKLIIYNGSPRKKTSNSDVLSNMLINAMEGKAETAKYYLASTQSHDEIIKDTADAYFIVFPLYADATPYGVKAFFEKMEENKKAYENKPIYFFIHSGFPEGKQSRLLERYLKYFCRIIGAECKSVCIMGSSEMTRDAKETSKKYIKIKSNMDILAQDILESRPFDETAIKYFNNMEIMPKSALKLIKVFPRLMDIGFNMMLKGNNAFDKRYDKPYA
ncbi:MAG: hypothetical protein AB1Z23_11080 [Eubacteriales bacterium]